MKDLYTFHTSKEDLDKWYEMVSDAYIRIFKRCGLDVKIVKSETGQIGGDEAHEFMVMKKLEKIQLHIVQNGVWCKY